MDGGGLWSLVHSPFFSLLCLVESGRDELQSTVEGRKVGGGRWR